MAKIVLFDIEITPTTVYTWSLFPVSISHESIIQDWSVICGAWKDLGSEKVNHVAIKTVGDDYEVVKTIREALSEADILVGHNLDKFDIKKLNARLIYHKLPPLPLIPTVDTLKEAKKIAAISSNRLDYLAKFMTGKGKIHVEYALWLEVMAGSKKAVKQMVEYNKVDVLRLEDIYNRLKPYMKRHPHVGVMNGEKNNCSCKTCGSTHVKKNGTRITAQGQKRQEIQCKKCGSYSQYPIPKSESLL